MVAITAIFLFLTKGAVYCCILSREKRIQWI
jgi:hypothetical protein